MLDASKKERPLSSGLQTKEVHCAGGIVCYFDQVLLIRQNGNSWSLPKGHVDPGESFEAAARREIEEESGVTDLSLVTSLPAYQRYRIGLSGEDDVTELKTMSMFLYHTFDNHLGPQESQSQAFWIPASLVGTLLTHSKDKAFYEAQLSFVLSQVQKPVICHVTFPDGILADTMTEQWLNMGLAACVQTLSDIKSSYMWQGRREQATEVLVMVKTWERHVVAIRESLSAAHPYEVPECIVTPITGGLPAYLNWMTLQT